MLYRNFETPEQIDAQYDIRRSVEDPAPFRAYFRARNEEAWRLPGARLGVAFGSGPDTYLDVYPAGAGAPVLMFVHGGYWRASSAREHAYAALGPHALGVSVVVTNYSLCPTVTMDAITRQNGVALTWIRENARGFGADPDRLVVAGHSAGAQQSALLLGSHGSLLRGAIGVSGIYDLRPLRFSFLQPKLRLDDALIQQQSPLFQIPRASPPFTIMVGTEESDEFVRQSRTQHEAWRAAGLRGELVEQPGLNHYTSAAQWADSGSAACAALVDLLA
ncbi:MAG: alpha/beta hydrolase [Acidobacteriota bacterium]